MGRGHEEQDPEEATQHGGHPRQEQPGVHNRSVQGRSSTGMERRGPQKEEEAVAARNGKDNMNKSTDAKEWSNRGGREPWGRTQSRELERPRQRSIRGAEAASGEKAWKPDRNVRGRSAPGQEYPGGGGPGQAGKSGEDTAQD